MSDKLKSYVADCEIGDIFYTKIDTPKAFVDTFGNRTELQQKLLIYYKYMVLKTDPFWVQWEWYNLLNGDKGTADKEYPRLEDFISMTKGEELINEEEYKIGLLE
jgi:hypothetical protein